ncbi:MerR family transcriptional regulator [Shimazuella alba]|uniref:MerR family transcriptional regulator n=1 Tax=Shimazuella alba TaxID=2690964 RepID=A0A6I4VZ76_9BACL|nr:MerR family transcriptional regulator [Shimazuella alba]MXQ53392.1 MerR family transcriptional regulator [Shimazuella alba]
MYYKPKEIAEALDVSTSALRHYESWGIVPAPARTKRGYRLYTEVHFAYFRCIRAMYPSFDMRVISKILLHIQQGEIDAAFWIVNEEQARLHQEKVSAEQTLAMFYNPDLTKMNVKRKEKMTIGEVAKLANVSTSAIRHWEKERLIEPNRDPVNGYRVYTQNHLRQISLICAFRNSVYGLESMRKVVQSVEFHTVYKAKRVLRDALESINLRNQSRFHGIHELYNLCKVTGLL